MRPHRVLLIATICWFGCASSPLPPQAAAPVVKPPAPVPHAPAAPIALEEYFKIRRVGSRGGVPLSFSHDEQQVAYLSDEAGRADVWVQPIAGGPAKQLTHTQGFVHSMAFSPTADLLVFEADVAGDELPHLFATDSQGAAPRDLTPDLPKGRRTVFIDWADDGKTFLFLSSLRDEKYLDLYEYDVAKNTAQRLWESSGQLNFGKASRDHKRFILEEVLSDANTNLYLVDRGKAGKAVLLTPHSGDVLYDPQAISRDDKTLYYTSDADAEFDGLYAMDLAKRTSTPVLKAEWDVTDASFSEAFKYFTTSVNENGTNKLHLSEVATNKPVALPIPPFNGGWTPLAWSRSDRYLGVRLRTDGTPTTPYVIDLSDGSARKVIDPLPASLQGHTMAVSEAVRIPSFDGTPVPGFLYRPSGNGPFPAIIDVHGGPTAQSQRDFDPWRQYVVSKGWAVLVPNVRGSTGYGKSYMKADSLDLGGAPLKDVVACKQWLVKEAHVDAARVVVLGGSYGGYMALAAAAFTPQEFAANVDYFGVSDLKSLVESFPPYWAAQSTFIYKKFGNPQNPEHAQYQHDRSPGNYVERIERPLLVVQGANDARVKKDQSDRIVSALKSRGVPVHYLVLDDEGHGFSRNENYLAAYKLTDRFLDHYIFGDPTVELPQ